MRPLANCVFVKRHSFVALPIPGNKAQFRTPSSAQPNCHSHLLTEQTAYEWRQKICFFRRFRYNENNSYANKSCHPQGINTHLTLKTHRRKRCCRGASQFGSALLGLYSDGVRLRRCPPPCMAVRRVARQPCSQHGCATESDYLSCMTRFLSHHFLNGISSRRKVVALSRFVALRC